jgi:hypothetical protein
MDFYIRKGATSPTLKLKLVDDGRTDISSFSETLENSTISFEMYDVKTNSPIILNGVCNIEVRKQKLGQTLDEYCIVYNFTEEGTSVEGRYEGIVTITFLDTNMVQTSKLIVPIKEKLYINVI